MTVYTAGNRKCLAGFQHEHKIRRKKGENVQFSEDELDKFEPDVVAHNKKRLCSVWGCKT